MRAARRELLADLLAKDFAALELRELIRTAEAIHTLDTPGFHEENALVDRYVELLDELNAAVKAEASELMAATRRALASGDVAGFVMASRRYQELPTIVQRYSFAVFGTDEDVDIFNAVDFEVAELLDVAVERRQGRVAAFGPWWRPAAHTGGRRSARKGGRMTGASKMSAEDLERVEAMAWLTSRRRMTKEERAAEDLERRKRFAREARAKDRELRPQRARAVRAYRRHIRALSDRDLRRLQAATFKGRPWQWDVELEVFSQEQLDEQEGIGMRHINKALRVERARRGWRIDWPEYLLRTKKGSAKYLLARAAR